MSNNATLEEALDYYYTDDVCVAETEEEMNELLTQKIKNNESN